MSLKTRAILVVVIGLIMGFGLSFGGGLVSPPAQPGPDAGGGAADPEEAEAGAGASKGGAGDEDIKDADFEVK